jgi:pyrimidine-nucleoside phosphorylase
VNDPRDVVALKRDGRTVPEAELREFVLGYAKREVGDEVAAAFLMAAYIRGLDASETLAMTKAMVDSGRTVALDGISRPKVDKHSTGGVADSVTLVFAPLAASVGLAVAKLSGRGLGHTGGTLDKLEAIPGLRTDLTPEEVEAQVEGVGCAVAAQSPDLVPADGALYALRDATATVSSVPLIAASVMSKKLAVQTDLILLDVKAGSGAFMKTPEQAQTLAAACMQLAGGWGRRSRAAVTDMSQPLGEAVGNALDVAEAVDLLGGRRRGRLRELAVLFAAEALASLEGVDRAEGSKRAGRALDDGSALEVFARMVEAQGGDPRVTEDPWKVLPRAPVVLPIEAPDDPAAGIVFEPKIGDRIETGQVLGEIHGRDEDTAREAASRVIAAVTLSDRPVDPPPLVHGWFGTDEAR